MWARVCVRACVLRGGAIMLLLFGSHMNSCMVINGTWSTVRLQTNYCLIFASPAPPGHTRTHARTQIHTPPLGRNTCRCRDVDSKHILTAPVRNSLTHPY